jgi:WD repeat-containing protein 89
VSIFDTSIQDENDSLLQAFDHGPIHKAGFLSDQDIYALSSDQRLTIYPVEDSELDESVVIQPAVLGDLRSKAQCDYVIDVLSDICQRYVITGSNLR